VERGLKSGFEWLRGCRRFLATHTQQLPLKILLAGWNEFAPQNIAHLELNLNYSCPECEFISFNTRSKSRRELHAKSLIVGNLNVLGECEKMYFSSAHVFCHPASAAAGIIPFPYPFFPFMFFFFASAGLVPLLVLSAFVHKFASCKIIEIKQINVMPSARVGGAKGYVCMP